LHPKCCNQRLGELTVLPSIFQFFLRRLLRSGIEKVKRRKKKKRPANAKRRAQERCTFESLVVRGRQTTGG